MNLKWKVHRMAPGWWCAHAEPRGNYPFSTWRAALKFALAISVLDKAPRNHTNGSHS